MSKEKEFRKQKEKLVQAEESLSVDMTSGLYELKDLVNELRDIRDSQFTASDRFKAGPSLDGGDFNQSLRKLEQALKECLEEYKRVNALRNLGDTMAAAVRDRIAAEKYKKSAEDMKHYNSVKYSSGSLEDTLTSVDTDNE